VSLVPIARFLMPLVLALSATTALTGAVWAQVRGQVGQSTDRIYDPAMDATRTRSSATSGFEGDSTNAARARTGSGSAAQSLGSASGTQGNVRAVVRKRTRSAFALTRPPNRVVRPPATASSRNLAMPMQTPLPRAENTDIVAPGLTEPPMVRVKKRKDDDPFAPVGLRLGGFTVITGVDLMAGADSNPLRSGPATKSRSAMIYQVAPDVSIMSEWSRHQLQIDLRGSYSYYPSESDASRPTFDGRVAFRGDLAENTILNLEARERIDTLRPGSTDLSSAVKGRPAYYTHSGSASVTHKAGYTALTAGATVDRTTYDNGMTYAGRLYDQQDRNYTTYGGRLRGAYEITPGISPYVEVTADTRRHDEEFDRNGYKRSSTGGTVRAGTSFEISRILTGDISAGYGERHYDDTRLHKLPGWLADASLVWQATPLTKVTAKLGSEFVETTTVGSSGAVSRKISLDVAHDLWRNLTLTGTIGYTNATYQGTGNVEQTIAPGVKLDYKIDRNFVVRGSYAFERSISDTPGGGYSAHTVMMGLRIQR